MQYPSNQSCISGQRRVVITGAGIATALGVGWAANADGFRAGRSAFRPVTLFDVSRNRIKVAAQLDLPESLPATRLPAHKAASLDRAAKMLLLAALEAWNQSGWQPSGDVSLILGTTSGGMTLGEAYYQSAVQMPAVRRHQAARALHYQAQRQGRSVADALGFPGPISIISNACASGANAVGYAWERVRNGQCDRAFAGGYDALSLLVFSGFDVLQTLSPTVCKPFDAHRDGLGLGEGAAMLALETLESATRRNAVILGEIIGYGATIDLHHLTQPHPQGDAAFKAMTLACETARVSPRDIDYLNAHGTGTPLNDAAEALAIQRWAGSHAASLPVSSTKACVGHLLGGAGTVEAVVCLMTLCGQWLPPELAFEIPDPACNFPIVQKPRDAKVDIALSNSFGFGGVNASLIFRRWQ